MDNWETMFRALQNIAREPGNFEDGLRRAFSAAHADPQTFDDPKFWSEAEQEWSRKAAGTVTDWGKSGLANLGPGDGWQCLLLDLGDCPETFRLYSPGGQNQMSEQKLRDLVLGRPIIEASELEGCVITNAPDSFNLLFGESRQEHANHNVEELDDDLLTWNKDGDTDSPGNNGYFLWLVFGSLAILEPLQDEECCRRVLAGRDKLYLLAGFEEIFTYLATVTQNGVLLEGNIAPIPPFGLGSENQIKQLALPLT